MQRMCPTAPTYVCGDPGGAQMHGPWGLDFLTSNAIKCLWGVLYHIGIKTDGALIHYGYHHHGLPSPCQVFAQHRADLHGAYVTLRACPRPAPRQPPLDPTGAHPMGLGPGYREEPVENLVVQKR